jgi:16S rRNA (guanine1207-N2)-methyltransferase
VGRTPQTLETPLIPDGPTAVYGAPPPGLVRTPAGATQVSPLVPGSVALEVLAADSLLAVAMAAPPGTVERRYALALALKALKPGGSLTALAPKDKGGARLRKELEAFGCAVEDMGRAHHRICHTARPAVLEGVDAAVAAGAPRLVESMGLWSQPGLFSWDRPDPGSLKLIAALPPLTGKGADLGCGAGLIARAVLESDKVVGLDCIDIDRRAVEAARRNLSDPRAAIHWADARLAPELEGLDFVVANPPFHDGGAEDRSLGQAFIRRAHAVLRKGGVLWLTANRHLPYEGVLEPLFKRVDLKGEGGGFKIYEARK